MELTEVNRKSCQFETFPEIFMRSSCNLYAGDGAVLITTGFFFCGFIVERWDRVIVGHSIIYFVLFNAAVSNSDIYHRMV